MKRLPAIFLNSPKAQCSIHESGNMIYSAIRESQNFEWDYVDLDYGEAVHAKNYACAIYNYHPATMPFLDLDKIRKSNLFKGTIILETLPDSVFALCPSDVFDFHLAIDPTIKVQPGHIYSLPRPIGKCYALRDEENQSEAIPTIGTFGLGTPGKGFERVVDAVNREFKKAIIRVNIPTAEFCDSGTYGLHQKPYADYLVTTMKRVAKPGVRIEYTRHFWSQEELVQWCRNNTVNVFLYDRLQPGLSATTDQAIAAGRPLVVSDNTTFRHIHPYVQPYPFWSIKDSIANGKKAVGDMQNAWNAESFRADFEHALVDAANEHRRNMQNDTLYSPACVQWNSSSKSTKTVSRLKRSTAKIFKKIKTKILKIDVPEKPLPSYQMPYGGKETADVLFVNHKNVQCGVHQYGRNMVEQLNKLSCIRLHYTAVDNSKEFFASYDRINPSAIIFNHYPFTMPWLTQDLAIGLSVPKLGFLHEMNDESVAELDNTLFDWHLVPDPTIQSTRTDVFQVPRLLLNYCNYFPLPKIPTFGSFGFGFPSKKFPECIDQIQDEYDEAKIVLHMPFNKLVDPGGKITKSTVRECKSFMRKPGISLSIRHSFVSPKRLLDSLAKNTANIFLYDETISKGISSVLEYAIASRRPLILNDCPMFRHVTSQVPEISVRNRSIKDIVSDGISPLVPFYNEWSEAMFQKRWQEFFCHVLKLNDHSNIKQGAA